MKLSTMGINMEMMDAMKGVTKVMTKVNDSMDVKSIRECLTEFAKQSEKMEMQGEMIADAIDMGTDTADDEVAADQIYNQVCEEIGINVGEEQIGAGTGAIATGAQAQPVAQNVDDLQERLN